MLSPMLCGRKLPNKYIHFHWKWDQSCETRPAFRTFGFFFFFYILIYIYLKKQNLSFHWFILQMPVIAKRVPNWTQELNTHSSDRDRTYWAVTCCVRSPDKRHIHRICSSLSQKPTPTLWMLKLQQRSHVHFRLVVLWNWGHCVA